MSAINLTRVVTW